MALAPWLRETLWRATDWRAALAQLCADASAYGSAELVDLARACELIDIDRGRALAIWRTAWQREPAQTSLERAFSIARELGALTDIAELALDAYTVTQDAGHLVTAAAAFIDAGTPERAIDPLTRAVAARHKDEESASTLAVARREVRDPQSEVSRWVATAARAGKDAARAHMQAARIARLAGLDTIYTRQLDVAHHRGSPEAATLVEIRLIEKRRAEDLAAFYRGRLDAAVGEREWVDIMRSAATRLHLANVQKGLALRLAQSGLAHAYRARLTEIPGHLALWDLLMNHAREAQSTRELMPLVVEALDLRLADDERLYLARFGVDASLTAGDLEATRPYAAIIDELTAPTALPELPVVAIRTPGTPSTSRPLATTPAPSTSRPIATTPTASGSTSRPIATTATTPAPPSTSRPVATTPNQSESPPSTSRPLVTTPTAPAPPPTSKPLVVTARPPVAPSASRPMATTPTAPAPPSTSRPIATTTPSATPSTSRPMATPASTPTPRPSDTPTSTSTSRPIDTAAPAPASATPTSAATIATTTTTHTPTTSTPTTSTPAPASTTAAPAAADRASASVIPASAAAALRKRPGVPSSPPPPPNATERAKRVVVAVDIEVYTPNGAYFSAVVRDLSTTGLFIVTKRELAVGIVLEVELQLPDANVLAMTSHRVNAKIVRRAERGYGLLMLEPSRELVAAIEALSVGSA